MAARHLIVTDHRVAANLGEDAIPLVVPQDVALDEDPRVVSVEPDPRPMIVVDGVPAYGRVRYFSPLRGRRVAGELRPPGGIERELIVLDDRSRRAEAPDAVLPVVVDVVVVDREEVAVLDPELGAEDLVVIDGPTIRMVPIGVDSTRAVPQDQVSDRDVIDVLVPCPEDPLAPIGRMGDG
jgi:hypothetical protein